MNKKIGLILIAMGIFLITSCNSNPSLCPDDFSLTLNWNTGALPPQYYYTYTIKMNPQGKTEFSYQPGYESNNADNWQTDFTLTPQQMDELYQFLEENNVLRSNWKKGQPMLGGSGTSIQINAGGKEYLIPSVSSMEQTDREIVYAVMDRINELVPREIWDEMNARQLQVEESYDYK
jgi:hypothetical protein